RERRRGAAPPSRCALAVQHARTGALRRREGESSAAGCNPPRRGRIARVPLIDVARRAFVASIVVVAVVVSALALWKLKLIIALLFLAFVIAAAMRPGVDSLRRRGIPRGFGVLIHYVALFAVVGGLLWLAGP